MLKKKYILPALGIIFILIQFIRIDKTNPPIDFEKDFISITKPSDAVAMNLKQACYDCHGHTTKYPWYTNVAPVSWWIKGHINNGRKHLNFSTWGDYSEKKRNHKVEENIEFLENRWMPLGTYKLLHPEAKLSEEEYEEIITFFKKLRG